MQLFGWLFLPLLIAGALVASERLACRLERGNHRWHELPWSDRSALIALGALLLVLALGVGLGQAGLFGRISLLTLTWALAALAWLMARGVRKSLASRAPEKSDWLIGLVLIALLATSSWFGTPAVDTRLEARDPGVYRLTSLRLQSDGALRYVDPLKQELSPEQWQMFFPNPSTLSRMRLPGFYWLEGAEGFIVPQFLPVPAVAMAIADLGNLHGPAAYSVLTAFLSSAALLLLGRNLLGLRVGALAGFWLSLNFVQHWFGRYGAAESAGQTAALVACYALVASRGSLARFPALVAAIAFGIGWFAKIELLALLGPLAVLFVSDAFTNRLRHEASWWLWVPLGAMATWYATFVAGWNFPYFHDVLLVFAQTDTLLAALPLAFLVVLTTAAVAWRLGKQPRAVDVIRRAEVRTRPVLAGVLVLTAMWAYWIRPLDPTRNWNAFNMPMVGWMISDAGLALAVLGCAALVMAWRTGKQTDTVLLLLLTIPLIFLAQKRIRPQLFWAYRRFLPTLLPLSLLAAAHCAVVTEWFARRHLARPLLRNLASGLVVVVVAVATAQQLSAAIRYSRVHDLTGAEEVVATLLDVLEPGDLVIAEPRSYRGLLRFEGAIVHVVGAKIVRLTSTQLDREVIEGLILSQTRRGQRTFLLTTGYLSFAPWLHAVPVASLSYATSALEETYNELPTEILPFRVRGRLYELRPTGAPAVLSGELDVGGEDELYLEGPTLWDADVGLDGRSYRWTRSRTSFWLPGFDDDATHVSVTMMGSDLAYEMDREVAVYLDDVEIGRTALEPDWQEYWFELPAGWAPGEAPRIGVDVTPPASINDAGRARTLGAAIDRIRWLRREPLAGALQVGDDDSVYYDGVKVPSADRDPGGRDFRWVGDRPGWRLPGLDQDADAVRLTMRGTPEDGAGDRSVTVLLDDIELGEIALLPGWQEHTLEIPPGWAQAAESAPLLALRVSETIALPSTGATGPRLVGLALDSIAWFDRARLAGGLDVGGADRDYLLGTGIPGAQSDEEGRTFRRLTDTLDLRLPGFLPQADFRLQIAARSTADGGPSSSSLGIVLDGQRIGTMALGGFWSQASFPVRGMGGASSNEGPLLELRNESVDGGEILLDELRWGVPTYRGDELDVGTDDDWLYLAGDAFAIETDPEGRTFRWMPDDFTLLLPGMRSTTRRIVVSIAGAYPPDRGEQTAVAYLDDAEIGRITVRRGFRRYEIEVPASWSPRPGRIPRFRWVVGPPLRPLEVLGIDDPRDLGFMLDWLAWDDQAPAGGN